MSAARLPLFLTLVLGFALAAPPARAAEGPVGPEEEGVSVTVYSHPGGVDPNTGLGGAQNVYNPMTGAWEVVEPGFSVVKERRRLVLDAGAPSPVRLDGVAARIDGSTVTFRSLSHDFEAKDAQRVVFPATVPPDGETVVTYTVKYTW